jgi:hypothetical protein
MKESGNIVDVFLLSSSAFVRSASKKREMNKTIVATSPRRTGEVTPTQVLAKLRDAG